jgi:Xaa-Pro dipeptidase
MRRRHFLSLTAGLLPVWACHHSTGAGSLPPSKGLAPAEWDLSASRQRVSAPSFTELAGYCDTASAPDAAEFATHLSALQRELERRQFAGIVLEPGANMQYLFGVRWGQSERPFLVFVPQVGQPTWASPAFEQRTAREQLGEQTKIEVWHEHESAYAVLAESVGVPATARIALDAGMRGFVLDGLQRAFGAARMVVDDPVASCRTIKSPAELARLRCANEATKAAVAAAAEHLRPGMREREFAELVKDAQTAAGLEHVWALVLFGSNASFPHGTRNEHPLIEGELVLVDTGGFLHGYASDISRTWALGQPAEELRRAWQSVHDAQSFALEHLVSGRPCSAAEGAARDSITRAGWGSGYEFFTHRLGHGIGLEVHEHPYLVRGNETLLQPGMVMSNEPGIYVAGKFGVRIEDIVAITSGEPEVFGARATSLVQPFGA